MSARRRVGLFGGSFDPIHRGHIEPVRAARERLGLERVVYLPTARPPHKSGREFAPAWARFAMTELALLDEPGLWVSSYEMTLERPSYTVDTLEHFRAEWPEVDLHLLIGEDSFADFDKWVRWRDILKLARLVVLARPGSLIHGDLVGLPTELADLHRAGGLAWIAERPVEVSSTEIRQALGRGAPLPDDALSPGVVKYILKYSLYR
ncbi:MAG: nicotinate (nicotinamide) nucleotide adenylyltransferase [Acidobacteriota bacterium]